MKRQVESRFNSLAGDNVSHFSQGGGSDGAPGSNAGSTYADCHRQALETAYLAELHDRDFYRQEAMIQGGFGPHFLSDMFAAGHIRTPRQGIEDEYNALFPDTTRLVGHMATFITDYIHDDASVMAWIAERWGRNFGDGSIHDQVVSQISEMGGAALKAFTVADILSGALHDADTRTGLDVVSPVDDLGIPVPGGNHWKAQGDNRMKKDSPTWKMALGAMRASLDELDYARKLGRHDRAKKKQHDAKERLEFLHKNVPTPYQALSFVPTVDPDSKDNVEFDWHWGHWNKEMKIAVDRTVRDDIVPRLRDKTPVEADGSLKTEGTLPIGKAFEAMVEDIRLKGHKWLLEALTL